MRSALGTLARKDETTSWRRRRWVSLAVAVAGLEVGFVWLFSARPPVPRLPSPEHRYRMLVDEALTSGDEEWGWLMTPSVFLLPSTRDFSEAGWLGATAPEVALEAFSAQGRPLSFQSARGSAQTLPLIRRVDPGPGSRWPTPRGARALPVIAPVAFSPEGNVRILEGLGGWVLARGMAVPRIEGAEALPRAVVRLAIDSTGEAASPPVIWEGTDDARADEAALGVVRGLGFRRKEGASELGPRSGFDWGLIAVTWPAPMTQTNVVLEGNEP